MSEKFFPTFRYSPEAPTGRKFTDEAEFNALGPEWVDTPTKLPAVEPAWPIREPDAPKKGRKAKEIA